MYLSLNPTGIGDCAPVLRAHEKTLSAYLETGGEAEQTSLIQTGKLKSALADKERTKFRNAGKERHIVDEHTKKLKHMIQEDSKRTTTQYDPKGSYDKRVKSMMSFDSRKGSNFEFSPSRQNLQDFERKESLVGPNCNRYFPNPKFVLQEEKSHVKLIDNSFRGEVQQHIDMLFEKNFELCPKLADRLARERQRKVAEVPIRLEQDREEARNSNLLINVDVNSSLFKPHPFQRKTKL